MISKSTSDLFENTCSASVKASSAQRVSGRLHIVSECTGSRLATASFVIAFASQSFPDMWKQLEAMESKKGFGASESSRCSIAPSSRTLLSGSISTLPASLRWRFGGSPQTSLAPPTFIIR